MVNDILFSIVIPAYNREKTIARSIESVISQTYKNFELIIVDDGSKDKTKNIVESYTSDTRVKYFYQENLGAQVARNHGLDLSRGKYILFLDSDDTILPDFVQKALDKFESDEDIGAVYCITGIYDKKGNIVPARKDTVDGICYKDVLKQGYLTSSSFISFRRCCFEKTGNWDPQFPASQDDDICFRFAKYYKIALIDEILGIYYVDAGEGKQISSSSIRVANGWWLLWNKFENDIVELCGIDELVKKYEDCLKRFIKNKDVEKMDLCISKLHKYVSTGKLNRIILKNKCIVLCSIVINRIRFMIHFLYSIISKRSC